MAWNLTEAIDYYKKQGAPGDQNTLITLLREIQRESGGAIPSYTLKEIANSYGIRESLLHALIRRIPSLVLDDHHVLEVCAGPNCGKSTAIAACAEKLCTRHRDRVTLRFSPCMRMCGKGPNIKWDGKVYHQVTESLLQELLK